MGLVPQIKRFADEKRQVNLAISLHPTDDKLRQSMLPVNKKYNIDEVLGACRYYVNQTGRRITFEWALINGVNDTPEEAHKQRAAQRIVVSCQCHSAQSNARLQKSGNDARTCNPIRKIAGAGWNSMHDPNKAGIDIQAGCGQLASTEKSVSNNSNNPKV